MTVSRVPSAGGMSVGRLQHSRRICAMEPPFATPRASQEKGACASVAWFSHRLGAVTSTLNMLLASRPPGRQPPLRCALPHSGPHSVTQNVHFDKPIRTSTTQIGSSSGHKGIGWAIYMTCCGDVRRVNVFVLGNYCRHRVVSGRGSMTEGTTRKLFVLGLPLWQNFMHGRPLYTCRDWHAMTFHYLGAFRNRIHFLLRRLFVAEIK